MQGRLASARLEGDAPSPLPFTWAAHSRAGSPRHRIVGREAPQPSALRHVDSACSPRRQPGAPVPDGLSAPGERGFLPAPSSVPSDPERSQTRVATPHTPSEESIQAPQHSFEAGDRGAGVIRGCVSRDPRPSVRARVATVWSRAPTSPAAIAGTPPTDPVQSMDANRCSA